MNITEKQLTVLKEIAKGHMKGASFVDLDSIIRRMPEVLEGWAPTKQTMQFIIRALISKGLIEKCELQYRSREDRKSVRGASVRTFKLTSGGAFEMANLPGASARAEVAEMCMSSIDDPNIELAIEMTDESMTDLSGDNANVQTGIE